jgi:hypothetical protein
VIWWAIHSLLNGTLAEGWYVSGFDSETLAAPTAAPLADFDTELEQLAMDTGRAPKRVLPTDPSNETSDIGR